MMIRPAGSRRAWDPPRRPDLPGPGGGEDQHRPEAGARAPRGPDPEPPRDRQRSGVGPGGVLRHPPRGALCFVPEKKCRKKLLILADVSNRMRKHAGKIAKNDFLVVLPPPLENRRSMAKKG